MKEIKVSVIIPVYGVEKYIERCVRSLFNQTLKSDIEFIFVDDRGPDNSMDILRNVITDYPERKKQIKIITNERNLGVAETRNRGVKNAVGKYIIHCDSDDFVSSWMYEKMLIKAEETTADVVFCDYIGVYPSKDILYKQNLQESKIDMINRLLDGSLHNGMWNKLINRKLYEKLDLLWTEGINMWDDVSVIPRLLYYAEKIAYVAEPLYFYNQTNMSSYTKTYSENIVSQIDYAYNTVRNFYLSIDDNTLYSDSLKRFFHRTLFAIISRSPREKRKFWIAKYNPIKDQFMQSMSKLNRIQYSLYLSGHNQVADLLSSLVGLIKIHTR